MRPLRDFLASDGYARPQQAWQCGLSDEGPPCTLGPGPGGRCPAAAACHPTRDGDRWICNRSPLRGGPCEHGPDPDGACAITHHCTPVRSLRTRRGRVAGGCFVAAIGAAMMTLSSSWRNELIAPGPLSAHHAHLVEGANATKRCAQCHAAGNATLASWAGMGGTPTVAAETQSALCMSCHERSIPIALATSAHNKPLAGLRHLVGDGESLATGSGSLRDAAAPIACAACHREHQGRDHDLAAIADSACQACHRERYHSFEKGHPDFGVWPYVRRTRIAFDHAAHQLKHHPAQQRAFACADCHASDATGERQLTRSYPESCAGCHEKALLVSLADGVPLIALPTLDVAALRNAGLEISNWPAAADGDFDGTLPAPTALLLAGKPAAADALALLGPNANSFDVDPEKKNQLAAAATIARELKALIDDVATRGQDTIKERLSAVLGREATAAEIDALSGGLSSDVAEAYRQQWFGAAEASAANTGPPRDQAAGGAWTRDAATLSLRYHAAGHADPWLRAWLDVLAAASTGPRAKIAEPLLRAVLKPTAAGQCGSCHSVERDESGMLAIQWRPMQPDKEPAALTRFSHASHLDQTALRDCTACHQFALPSASAASATSAYASDDPRQFVAGFKPLTKSTCVACHTAGGAGNSCTECHRYHGGAETHALTPPLANRRVIAPAPLTTNR